MRIQDSSTIIRHGSRIVLSLAVLLTTTGCEERKRLAAEIATVRQETSEVQPQFAEAQAELNRTNKAYAALRLNPVVKKTGADNLEKEVGALTERKNTLESEVAALRKELETYRKANP